MTDIIHVYAEFSDGTDQTCDVPDLETAAHEIEETITGCDFAISLTKVVLVDDEDKEIEPLEATWSLSLNSLKL